MDYAAQGQPGVIQRGELYASPSGAAKAVVGRAANGWRFWHYKKGAVWVPLAELRE